MSTEGLSLVVNVPPYQVERLDRVLAAIASRNPGTTESAILEFIFQNGLITCEHLYRSQEKTPCQDPNTPRL